MEEIVEKVDRRTKEYRDSREKERSLDEIERERAGPDNENCMKCGKPHEMNEFGSRAHKVPTACDECVFADYHKTIDD